MKRRRHGRSARGPVGIDLVAPRCSRAIVPSARKAIWEGRDTPETPLEISTDGKSLNIRPLHKRTLEQAKAHIKKNLGKAMEKLAK